jgi:hypothetical protein
LSIRETNYRILKRKSSQLTSKQVELHERRQVALSLRTAGASYQDIVNAKIGYRDVGHVSKDIRHILQNFVYETPEDVLVLDLARLDEMQKVLTAAFRTGDYGQAGIILRIMQFRRETLGITPDVIANRRNDSQALVNNGIMVVQGTASDFLDGMMQAAGASEKERSRELEKVAKSNTQEVIDAEVVEVHENIPPFVENFSSFAEKQEIKDTARETLPQLDLTETLTAADTLSEPPLRPGKRRLRIPAKLDDANVQPTSGISYRRAPQKLDEEKSKQLVRRRLVRSQRKSDVEDLVDELDSETTEESF